MPPELIDVDLAAPAPAPAGIAHIEGRELPSEDIALPIADEGRRRGAAERLVWFVAGLGAVVTALGLMKAGAAALVPSLEGSFLTDHAWSTLGLGWLGAAAVLSGSPVAASALTLLDGGAIDRLQSFTMLAGSRIGAAFVVLVAGAVYALRHRGVGGGRRAPMSIGILSLLMTAVAYVPGAIVGSLLLASGTFDAVEIGAWPALSSTTDAAFGWIVDLFTVVLPPWALFPVGLGALVGAFSCFDRVLPSLGAGGLAVDRAAWLDRKWPMFLLGGGVCLLTLSVSVALTVLVPLVAKGYLRRANTLPYIAGANITTLADTLVAALLLGNQDAVRVVLAVSSSVSVWTVLLLAFAYDPVRAGLLAVARTILESRRNLAGFVGLLFVVPVGLLVI